MYCRQCGRKIEQPAKYCRYCGCELEYNSKLQRQTTLCYVFCAIVVCLLCFGIYVVAQNPELVQQQNHDKKVTNQYVENGNAFNGTNSSKKGETQSTQEDSNRQVRSDNELMLGSAKRLEGSTILIAIFVDINKNEWKEEEKQYCKDALQQATSWIVEKGMEYNKEIEFLYNMQEGSDLLYYQSIDFDVDSDSDDTNQSDYYRYNKLWIQEHIDKEKIKKDYGTDSVGYLFFVKDAGTSYTFSHYIEDKMINKEEMCTIYLNDSSCEGCYETPATYAHEILHLYGALDLYKDACPKDINEYVEEQYPLEIMLSTYDEPLFIEQSYEPGLTKEISPITAYNLGWITDIEEINEFPDMKRENAACFSVEDYGGYYKKNQEEENQEGENQERLK